MGKNKDGQLGLGDLDEHRDPLELTMFRGVDLRDVSASRFTSAVVTGYLTLYTHTHMVTLWWCR